MAKSLDHALALAITMASESRTLDGQIPLERVLTRHWPTITAWRAAGWTWRQIAALLCRAGMQLKDGDAVTGKYLSAVGSRINRAQHVSTGQGEHPNREAPPRDRPGPLTTESPKVNASKLLTSTRTSAYADEPAVGRNRRDEIRARMQQAAKSRGGD